MNKRRIVLRKHDSLLAIFTKIASDSAADLQIEIEENEAICNYLNLKLLLHRFPNKRFSFITNDPGIRKIGEPLGIKFFRKNDDIEFEQEYAKKNLLQHNFTFAEYALYEVRKFLSKTTFLMKRKTVVYKNRKIVRDSNVFLLVSGLILSLSLLSFIFYFAVSKTYVTITPELGIKTISRNIVYAEREPGALDAKNTVNVRTMTVPSELSYTFNVTTIDEMSTKNSYGTVEIFNELQQEQTFRPNTRFTTDDGIVFKTQDWIKVAGTRTESGVTVIGKTKATLMADTYDLKGNIVGKRGNIGEDVTLTIPGLKFNRDKIYAKTIGVFAGGIDPKIHVLTEKELTGFKDILAEKLRNKALEELKEKIKKTNAENAENYEILPINDNIIYKLDDITLEQGAKIGEKREEVSLHGKIAVTSHLYDKSAALFYLKTILNESLLFGTEKLIGVNDSSLRISNVVSQGAAQQFTMKATSELDATISYNFEDSSNNLTKKLKNLIVNNTVKDATSILLNDNNIASVKITFSPFWLSRISNNPDNIEFIIQK